ncbi:MAG TPA: hypothetical protein VFJ58_26290 [Armatimonadota bacterium]|nr:hypothetical protein [Armatimonadota bacterium]
MNVRQNLAVAALAAAVAILGSSAAWALPAVGAKAPGLDLPTAQGPKVNLKAIHTPVLLNFFTTY